MCVCASVLQHSRSEDSAKLSTAAFPNCQCQCHIPKLSADKLSTAKLSTDKLSTAKLSTDKSSTPSTQTVNQNNRQKFNANYSNC